MHSKVDPSLGCQLLTAMLPLGAQFLDPQTPQDTMETTLDAFEDFFESLVLLAGTNKNNGHLILVKAVEEWLPICINLVKNFVEKQSQEAATDSNTEDSQKQAFVPVGTLFRYLSYLTSSVQFVTNMMKCTEKRTLAGEYDGPLYDSDSEDDGEGVGGTDVDEDSQAEDSVRL